MAGHDVSKELRGYHGRWATSGVIKRLASEATHQRQTDELRATASVEDVHKKVQDIANLPEGKGKGIQGILVANMGDKGLKVRLPGATRHYKDPREAAVAVYRKQHHEEGSSPIPLPGTETAPGSPPLAPSPPRPSPSPPSAPAAPRLERLTSSEISRELYKLYQDNGSATLNGIHVKANSDASYDVTIDGKAQRYGNYADATLAIYNKKHNQFGSAVPGSAEEKALRKIAAPKPGQVAHPQTLTIARGAGRTDTVAAKKMRQQVLKATTHQAQATPDLVAKTQVTITKSPHGERGTSTLASHTGQGNTLHVKPEVLTGNNTQAVLDHNKNAGWWVPSDKEHDLSMNVMTHEFGHGVHGELNRRGILMANRAGNATIYGEPEMDFWRGFAKAAGLSVPPVTKERGRDSMNVAIWLNRNKLKVERVVSRYGAHNMNEMIAEMWTEYRLSSNPRSAAKYFGDYVTRRLNES